MERADRQIIVNQMVDALKNKKNPEEVVAKSVEGRALVIQAHKEYLFETIINIIFTIKFTS